MIFPVVGSLLPQKKGKSSEERILGRCSARVSGRISRNPSHSAETNRGIILKKKNLVLVVDGDRSRPDGARLVEARQDF